MCGQALISLFRFAGGFRLYSGFFYFAGANGYWWKWLQRMVPIPGQWQREVSAAPATINGFFVASGMPSERSERVLIS